MKKIGILGSTGSIGSQALDIIKEFKEEFELVFISGNSNIDKLTLQAKEFSPKYVCLSDNKKQSQLNDIKYSKVSYGEEALLDLCSLDVDIVLNAISGYKGLYLSIKLIENEVDIALSNKESIVQAGSILMRMAKEKKINIFPVDSEHSALWQCIIGESKETISRFILTGSGGPFRNLKKKDFESVTVEQALNHPNWAMGDKITIDSATMMNKGFEVIEAHWLFDIDYDNIDIVVHPQSIIHSMVEFIDGSIKAQMGNPSMRIPIQFALMYPQRLKSLNEEFNFIKNSKLTFEEADLDKFNCIKLAYDAGKAGGTYPTVLNVSNDMAVDLFLNKKIQFTDIAKLISQALDLHENISNPNIDDIKGTIIKTEQFINNIKKERSLC